MSRILSLHILILLFVSSNSLAQNDVEADLTFNTADTIPYGTGASGWINNSVVQPDGKIIIIGPINLFNGQPTGGLLRLNPNGTIDNSFNAWYNYSSEAAISIYLQTDGKVLVGGAFSSFNGVPRNSIVRLNNDGSLDPGFDSGTGIAGPYGDPNTIKKITVDANGKILIGGCFASYNGNLSNCIARLNSDGTFDNSFNSGLGFSAPLNQPSINEIEIQSDGKLLVGGNVNSYNGTSISNMIRLNVDGSVDNTFNLGVGFNGHVLSINSLADGKIIVAGEFTSYNGHPVGNITRLFSNGNFDTTFNTVGAYTSGANAQITSTVIQNDGKIIAVGSFSEYNEISFPGITKLNADGSPDTLLYSSLSIFGGIGGAILLPNNDVLVWGVFTRRIAKYNSDGSFNYSFLDGTGANEVVSDLAKQQDGKIIVCGGFHAYNAEEQFSLIRLNTDGSRDTSFNLNVATGYISSAIVQPDQKILVRGTVGTFSGIVRLNSDGSVDPTFNVNSTYGYTAMALQPDGKIVAGIYLSSSGIDQIVRFNSDGTLDNSFTGPNVDGQFFDIAIQSNGQIIIGGDFSAYDSGYTTELAKDIIRLNADGSLDPSFGVTLNIINGIGNWVQSIVQQPDQKILIAGNFIQVNGEYHYRIARLNMNGTLDSTFIAIGANNVIKDLALNQDGKIVMGGTFSSVNGTPTHYITRLNSNGTLDPDFTVSTDSDVSSVLIQDDANIVIGGMFTHIDNILRNHIGRITGGCSPTFATEIANANCSYIWSINNQVYTASGQYTDTIPNVSGCDSIITLDLTIINSSSSGIDTQISNCTSYTWIDGITYTTSNNSATFTLTNANGCDSIVTLNLSFIPATPITASTFSQPSDANSCTGNIAVTTNGNGPFILNFDNGATVINSSGYSLVQNLCPGVHDLLVTDFCTDSLITSVVIPIDSNYVFNNPFIDSLAQDSLGITLTDCDIYYAGIDTAYIDSIWANGNTVNVIWNIVDANGSNFDTTSYVLNNGNGVYWLQLSVFCPVKAMGDYFTVTEAIYFNDGTVSSAGISDREESNIVLFPNPTNDLVTISFDGNAASLTIYDAQGKLIRTSGIQPGGTVSLKDVQTGVYFFELTTEKGSVVKRVVKN